MDLTQSPLILKITVNDRQLVSCEIRDAEPGRFGYNVTWVYSNEDLAAAAGEVVQLVVADFVDTLLRRAAGMDEDEAEGNEKDVPF